MTIFDCDLTVFSSAATSNFALPPGVLGILYFADDGDGRGVRLQPLSRRPLVKVIPERVTEEAK